MEEATGPQKEVFSQLKRVSLKEAEFPSPRKDDQSIHEGDQDMQPRVDEERPVSPAPTYLSMKSDRSMGRPINFKKGDTTQYITQIYRVHPARSESPTPSYSAMSDSSIQRPINYNDGGLPKIPGDVLCDSCSDVNMDKRAVKTCQTCSSSYCEKHIRKHYTRARFQTHQLVDVPGGLEPCQHHHKPLEVFCLTDRRFVCSQCSVTKHRGHDIHHQTQQAGGKRSAGVGAQRPRLVHVLPPPGEISFLSVKPDSVTLSWGPPEGLEGSRKFRVTWEGDGEQMSLTVTDMYRMVITGLQPGQKYDFSVATQRDHGNHSNLVSASTYTVVPPPGNIKVDQFGPSSFKVHWSRSPGMDHVSQSFLVSYTSPGEEPVAIHTEDSCTTLTDLQPGTLYTVGVCTVLNNGQQSDPVNTIICTKPPSPAQASVRSINTTSVQLTWDLPGPRHVPLSFKVTWNSGSVVTTDNRADITDLRPETEYTFSICTTEEEGVESDPVTKTIRTKCSLNSYLKTLGLEQSYGKKVSLNEKLSINAQMFDPKHVSTPKSQCSFFLRELMKANVLARDKLSNLSDEKDLVNPLDLITALFLCSDHFLQQEIALKMSLCQFAVPLLLPNCETQQITLMLWAMRDIVKRYRPHSLDQNEFVEDSIVLANLPMVSFVRLGYSSLSKSELLNNVLSKSQQTNRSFVHRNMAGGNSARQISDGLVEVTWYFPCGNPNTDVFSDPVAVANLRGDIQDFPTQFEFLCKTSAAVFVFCDGFSSDSHVLSCKHLADRQLFIVSNTEAKSYDAAAFELLLQLKQSAHIKKGSRMNNVQLVQKLHSVVTRVVKTNPVKFSVEKMAEEANKLNIHVDEDFNLCQAGKKSACSITDNISDITDFKKKHLPLHVDILVELVKLEREQSKHKYAGRRHIEEYKSELRMKQNELRTKQVYTGVTTIMDKFIDALKNSEQCCFFLKWMKINLDNLSRQHLSKLREKYKNLCESSPGDDTKISDLKKKISLSSLGIEDFLREFGQLYESAQSLPKNHLNLRQYEQLPGICAQLMLDGFSLELIDGDASYIPMKWISDVLRELHSLASCNSKVRVITVLGVQSSGKSTLLNTMFGIQFAVSGGRCTRGAFMQLIRVEEDLKKQLDCDFIMVIDTEGLKAPQLAQLVNSYEHDNELATMVVGLSDITIINIAMENAADMKDTLQIVVHAFLRMKEVGKKHMCQFVHQNVPDCSAHAKNTNDRQLVLQDLNDMTKLAAKMERKEHNKRFTDIMDYDPEKHSCYLPGLWHGSPPMAPVNAGYSEAGSELKKSIIQRLIDLETPAVSILQFSEWTKDVWNAVKHENFIFSFRNSLEADAYNHISLEFKRLDWTFQNNIQVWVREAEMEISNCDPSDLGALNSRFKKEGTLKLQTELSQMQDKLNDYYKKAGKDAQFIERHQQSFVNSTKALHDDMENSVIHKLKLAVESKRSMAKIELLKKTHSCSIEQQVMKLLEECKSKGIQMNSKELDSAFEVTWKTTVDSLEICKLETQDIDSEILTILRKNIQHKAGTFKILNDITRLDDQSPEIEVVPGRSGGNWFAKHFKKTDQKPYEQLASSIIGECKQSIANRVKSGSDYTNMDALDVLKVCDTILDKNHILDVGFEANLKIKMCAHASRQYQKMHKAFIEANDPQRSLEELKPKFLDAFKDLFFERNQCEKKAEEFTKVCLEPAVIDYVNDSLGPDIVKTMKLREIQGNEDLDLRTRTYFEFSLLKQLLFKDEFKQFVNYTRHHKYKQFVKASIVDTTVHFFSKNESLINDLLKETLKQITAKIEQVIKMVRLQPPLQVGQTISTVPACSFIDCICSKLKKDLSFPQDGLDLVRLLNKAMGALFLDHLEKCVKKMKESLDKEFNKDMDVKARLEKLPTKPQDEIFDNIIGCGETCPFCRAPCEATQPGHKEHFVTIHRPKGIGRYRLETSEVLTTDICTSSVTSENTFKCSDTNDVRHPYKDYRSIYPDWLIQPDPSIEASDYWKYVFAKYNQHFADKYESKPADIPPGWEKITQEQAMESLEKSYRLKPQ